MASVVFLSLPLFGHINPSLPLVRELVARGEQVTYYATDGFRARIEATGANYQGYRSAYLADLRALPEQTNELPWRLTQAAEEVLPTILAALRTEKPRFIITDSVAPWGQWAAQILRVPVVTSVSTFAFNRHVMAYAVATGVRPKSLGAVVSKLRHLVKARGLMAQLRRTYGVPGPGLAGSVMGRSDLNIVYTSRAFQPCSETFDSRFEFVGPLLGLRTEAADIDWTQIHRPVVYVSLGTLFNADTAFYRDCMAACHNQDVQVIVSTGSQVSPESLGPLASNVIARAHVAQLDVLQHASAFVTHGGMNSVSESLFHGVPMLVVPQMGEQELVARRVVELGAGLHLAKAAVSAVTVRAMMATLLSEPDLRLRAEAVGASLREAGGVTRAADRVLGFAGGREESASQLRRRH